MHFDLFLVTHVISLLGMFLVTFAKGVHYRKNHFHYNQRGKRENARVIIVMLVVGLIPVVNTVALVVIIGVWLFQTLTNLIERLMTPK